MTVTPTPIQQPFHVPLHHQSQHDILEALASQDIAKQKAVMELLGITWPAGGYTMIVSTTETGKPLDESDFVSGDDYVQRAIKDDIQTISVSTTLPDVPWQGDKALPITVDMQPNHLSAARITVINHENQPITIPIDGIGTPKPLGFMQGSHEGGIAEGGHCQDSAFTRQLQLALIVAAGASDADIDRFITDRQPIDHFFHDRGLDGMADSAIAKGVMKNGWEYAASLPASEQSNRLIETYQENKAMPDAYFQKLLGSGSSVDTSSNGKLTPEYISQELGRINDNALTEAYTDRGADGLRDALQNRQSLSPSAMPDLIGFTPPQSHSGEISR